MPINIYSDIIETEIGNLYIYWSSDRVQGIYFSPQSFDLVSNPGFFRNQFGYEYDYLSNLHKNIYKHSLDVLDLSGFTEFELDVYRALCEIEYGSTVTYGSLAAIAGYPRAARAVGNAMRKNRFPLLIPCHRVVSRYGIGNYSMGGIEIKKKIMALEGICFYERAD